MAHGEPDAAGTVASYADRLQDDQPWLVAASTLAACGRSGEARLGAILHESIAHQHDQARMREVLLQTLLFAGYPCALNALSLWHSILSREAPGQLGGLADEKLENDDPAGFAERGREHAGQVYGRNLQSLLTRATALSPDLAHWMIVDGYGRVLGRPNLPFPLREACIVATLVPASVERQLYSHIKGCLNVGLTPDIARAVVDLASEFSEPDASELARQTLEAVLARRS